MSLDSWIERYAAGESCRTIADSEGIDREKVRYSLKAAGVQIRRPGAKKGTIVYNGPRLLNEDELARNAVEGSHALARAIRRYFERRAA